MKISTCCNVPCKRYFEGYIRADNKRGGKVVGMRYKCGACGMTQKKSILKVMCEFHGKQTSVNGCCPKCPQVEYKPFAYFDRVLATPKFVAIKRLKSKRVTPFNRKRV